MLKMNGIEATKAVCINPSTLKKCAPVLEGGYMKSSTKRFWYWRPCLRLVHGCQKVWCNYGERLFAAEKLRKSLIGAGADTGNRFSVWKSKRGSIYILKRTVIKKKRPSWPKKLEWESWIYDAVYSWCWDQYLPWRNRTRIQLSQPRLYAEALQNGWGTGVWWFFGSSWQKNAQLYGGRGYNGKLLGYWGSHGPRSMDARLSYTSRMTSQSMCWLEVSSTIWELSLKINLAWLWHVYWRMSGKRPARWKIFS